MPAATIVDVSGLPAMLTKQQLQGLLGISPMKADALLREPDFPVFRHGRVIRIPRRELLQWLASYGEREPMERS
jgi:Helix-turn-helix domain